MKKVVPLMRSWSICR